MSGLHGSNLWSQYQNILWVQKSPYDFAGGSMVKNSSANAGNAGSIPDPGRSHPPQSN